MRARVFRDSLAELRLSPRAQTVFDCLPRDSRGRPAASVRLRPEVIVEVGRKGKMEIAYGGAFHDTNYAMKCHRNSACSWKRLASRGLTARLRNPLRRSSRRSCECQPRRCGSGGRSIRRLPAGSDVGAQRGRPLLTGAAGEIRFAPKVAEWQFEEVRMMSMPARVLRTLLFLSLVSFAIPLFAQQTGSISGKVTASDGSALPGVTVEARSERSPRAPGDRHRRPGGIPVSGPASGRLHAEVRPLRHDRP